MFTLKKIEIRNILGDENNPRILTEEKFKLLNLSLSKFGLLSPLFITTAGKLLSGHQRAKVLRAMGEEYTYCIVLNNPSLSVTNAVNFAFNKEMQEIVNSEEDLIGIEEKQKQLKEYLESLEDIEDKFKYLKEIKMLHKKDIIQTEIKSKKARGNSALLYRNARVIIPLILDENLNIINGNARYQVYSKLFNKIPCIVVKGITNNVFRYITANYSLKGRENNIRVEQRRGRVMNALNIVYGKALVGEVLETASSVFREKYMRTHYKRILDFGAGNGKQTVFARHRGHDITLFEPFATSGKGFEFSLVETYKSLGNMLIQVEKEEPFDLVVANAVLNSVPFKADTLNIVVLLKFLSAGARTLLVSGRATRRLKGLKDKDTSIKIKELGENSIIGTGSRTKVQNFHNKEDMAEFFGSKSQIKWTDGDIYCRVDNPKYEIGREELKRAVEFEFGIRYNNRTFYDIKEDAIRIFMKKYDKNIEKGLIIGKK